MKCRYYTFSLITALLLFCSCVFNGFVYAVNLVNYEDTTPMIRLIHWMTHSLNAHPSNGCAPALWSVVFCERKFG